MDAKIQTLFDGVKWDMSHLRDSKNLLFPIRNEYETWTFGCLAISIPAGSSLLKSWNTFVDFSTD